jgi:hypothetical protein
LRDVAAVFERGSGARCAATFSRATVGMALTHIGGPSTPISPRTLSSGAASASGTGVEFATTWISRCPQLRECLGHESLDVTLAYLKGSDAASEPVQEQVANGALAAYV